VASAKTRAEVNAELKRDTPVANREPDELRDNAGY
jgi:hypothetical protein